MDHSVPTEEQSKQVERLLRFGTGRPTSPFDVLEISPEEVLTVTTTAVTKKFRHLSLILHPDKCPHPEAGVAFAILEKSYNALRQEAVLLQLQRAERKKREQEQQERDDKEQKARKREFGQKRDRVGGEERGRSLGMRREEEGGPSPPHSSATRIPPLGKRSHLSPTGVSSEAQKEAEIKRILSCALTNYFDILDVDPEADFDSLVGGASSSSSSSLGEREGGGEGGRSGASSAGVEEHASSERFIRKTYRRLAQSLHPDKCHLPGAVEAFQRVERAQLELVDAKKFIRYKAGYQQARKKEDLLQRSRGTGCGFGFGGMMAGESGSGNEVEDDPLEARRAADRREQVLKAARLAEEIAEKKRREEAAAEEDAALGAMLEKQRKGWKELMML